MYQYKYPSQVKSVLWNPGALQAALQQLWLLSCFYQNFPSSLIQADLSEYLVSLTQKEEKSELFYPIWFGIQLLLA